MKQFKIILRILIALLFLQTLFFKFTASEESVYIFTKLGLEPFGRIASGIAELIASILLLFSSTYLFGAIFSLAIISGAIISHIFILGFVVQNDGGLLFFLALTVFICSLLLIYLEKDNLVNLYKRILKK